MTLFLSLQPSGKRYPWLRKELTMTLAEIKSSLNRLWCTACHSSYARTAYQPWKFVFPSHYIREFGCSKAHASSVFFHIHLVHLPMYSLYSFGPTQPLLMTLHPAQQRSRGWLWYMCNIFRLRGWQVLPAVPHPRSSLAWPCKDLLH